jgi:hypothetical protein
MFGSVEVFKISRPDKHYHSYKACIVSPSRFSLHQGGLNISFSFDSSYETKGRELLKKRA